MNRECFLVTRGDYSDYRVCAVFTEKELAEKYINSFRLGAYEDFMIENYSINPCEFELNNNYKPFFLRMTKEGDCTEINISDSDYNFEGGRTEPRFDIHKKMYMSVFAKDEKHAIKIANEKRIELIALNKWA